MLQGQPTWCLKCDPEGSLKTGDLLAQCTNASYEFAQNLKYLAPDSRGKQYLSRANHQKYLSISVLCAMALQALASSEHCCAICAGSNPERSSQSGECERFIEFLGRIFRISLVKKMKFEKAGYLLIHLILFNDFFHLISFWIRVPFPIEALRLKECRDMAPEPQG